MNIQQNLSSPMRFCISNDGYIRLTLIALQSVHLTHLDSGLYDDGTVQANVFDKACSILGYTEWVTETEPAISIGWDWTVECYENPIQYKMVGYPFSNIMLQDASGKDLEDEVTLQYVASFIGQIKWQPYLVGYITNRYS